MSKAGLLFGASGKIKENMWGEPQRVPSLRDTGQYWGSSDCPGGHRAQGTPDLESQSRVFALHGDGWLEKPPQPKKLEPRARTAVRDPPPLPLVPAAALGSGHRPWGLSLCTSTPGPALDVETQQRTRQEKPPALKELTAWKGEMASGCDE